MNKLLILPLLFCTFYSFSQSPPELLTPIDYDSNPTVMGNQFDRLSVAGIAAGYDNGRRNEEMQFSIPTNALGNLIMPSQAVWDSMSTDEKVLYLVNAERTARHGVNYNDGQGPVKGYPITGIESNVDNLAQAFASNFTIANISDSLDMNPLIGGIGCMNNDSPVMDCCHELLSPSQPSTPNNNLVSPAKGYIIPSTAGTVSTGIEVRVVYEFIYLFSNRLFILQQDEDLNPMTSSDYGFNDNYGEYGDEGFMGVGLAIGTPPGGTTHITYLAIVLFDPLPASVGCNYNCTTCGTCPMTITENGTPIPQNQYQASDWIKSAGLVQNPSAVEMQANNFIVLNPQFHVAKGAMFHAYIDGCYFTSN